METIKKYPGVVVLVIAVLLLIGLTTFNNDATTVVDNGETQTSETDNKNKDNPKESNKESSKEDTSATDNNTSISTNAYTYTAQPGDTYSELARKAVQTYGIVNGVTLSQAQIVAAETQLAANAGFPLLNEGQRIEFNAADVKAAVDYASSLTAAQQTEWQTYVVWVDFNTNDNGEVVNDPQK